MGSGSASKRSGSATLDLIGSNNEGNLVLADGRHVLAVTYKRDVPANDAIDADQAIVDFLN